MTEAPGRGVAGRELGGVIVGSVVFSAVRELSHDAHTVCTTTSHTARSFSAISGALAVTHRRSSARKDKQSVAYKGDEHREDASSILVPSV